MRLRELSFSNFRCLHSVTLSPGAGLNLIRGENAQGKTSLLEAVMFTATSKSHRTSNEADLVTHGQDTFHTAIEVERDDRIVRIECHWHKGAKRFKVNGVSQTRLSDLLGKVSLVLFSPEDVQLIRGRAGPRRRYLDMELAQISPPYLSALQHYRQALKQRNELLRQRKMDPALLSPWEVQLCEQARVIHEHREAYIAELSKRATEKYTAIAEQEHLELRYAPDVADPSLLLETLERNRESDQRRQTTQHGPHRDDIGIRLDDQPARTHASQGQQKSIVLALKLAEVDLIRSRIGENPILMMDEVMAELDSKRSASLLEAMTPDVQCLLTTTRLDATAPFEDRQQTEFLIRKGDVEPVTANAS